MSKISIKSAALSYQKLFDYEYQFTVVRNRNTQPINICIRFDKSTFHHLCGLHKLKDIEVVRREKRESVFDKIIDGTYSDELFQKSTWYDEILAYMLERNPDKLQELVNQGEIYSYLLKLETRAKDAEFDQIEKWLASDKEYLLAVKNDDFMKRTQLYNAFQEQARELILDSIIFV